MIRVVLVNGAPGIAGAVILGLGRALGETMAVTMVIGNRPEI
jgi:phosphate transport system permease protein